MSYTNELMSRVLLQKSERLLRVFTDAMAVVAITDKS